MPVFPVRNARRIGVEMFSAELRNDVYGPIRGTANGAEMYFDRHEPEKRWTFTAAASWGIRSSTPSADAKETSYGDRRSDNDVYDPREVFANHFAGALLVPARAAAAVSTPAG